MWWQLTKYHHSGLHQLQRFLFVLFITPHQLPVIELLTAIRYAKETEARELGVSIKWPANTIELTNLNPSHS